MTTVKFCGLMRAEDAREAARLGARYVGVILTDGFGRSVPVERAKEIVSDVRDATVVTVRVDDPVERVVEEAARLGAGVVQLHGDEGPGFAAAVRDAGPWAVWKAVRMRAPEDLCHAVERFGEAVDGLLLDGWHPERPGGTGRAFSWEAVADLRAAVPDELGLVAAGGLAPDNVGRAIRMLRPDVVDVSSGVESAPGVKDHDRMRAFADAVCDTDTPAPDAGDPDS